MPGSPHPKLSGSIAIDLGVDRGRVHDHLYGANLEHIGRCVYQGHWAELLQNRKFLGHDKMFVGANERLSHHNPSYGVVTPWTALAPDYERVLFVHDNSDFYTGDQSQRITIREADGDFHGVQQDGLTLVAGATYAISLVLKGEGQQVRVCLGDQTWMINDVGPGWQEYSHSLTLAASDADATFSIAHADQASLWIGCTSVMPSHTLDGHRSDVVETLSDWTPTFLRWPGGNFASAYRWEQGIGPRDRRPGYLDPAWNTWESNDVGTHEFMDLCRHVGSEPILTINMGNADPAEAARWVEYCNGGADTPMGKLRAANGSLEPFAVRTWFVGNEQFGNWQVGTCDAETYARRYLDYAAAMLQADPTLDLIAVGAPTNLYGHWNELVLQTAGDAIKKLSVHYYSIRTEKRDKTPAVEEMYWPKVASAHEVTEMLDRTYQIVCEHADPPPPIIFDEWNTYVEAKPPDFFENYSMADALYAGALMNACLQRAAWIKMSASFNLLNVMGNLRVSPTQVWKTPTGLVLELYTRYRGVNAVGCEASAETVATPELGNLPAFDSVCLIDAAATRSADGATLYLSVVNRDPERQVDLDVSGIDRAGTASIHLIQGAAPQALNTEDDPEAVTIEHEDWPMNTPLSLPAHSVAIVEIPLESRA